MARATRLEIRNDRTRQVTEQLNQKMEDWTMAQLHDLGATHSTRGTAQRAYDKVVCARRYLLVPKHTEEERFFLRLMLLHTLALKPALQAKAYELAEYLSSNYPYEWTQTPITRYARRRARDLILSAAESEFGETPMAGPLAYVYHHVDTVGVENPSDYGECYVQAASLVRHRHFTNTEQTWRERLGLHALHLT